MPSNAVLEAKKAKVEQLTELIKNSVSGVLVDYKGITVEEDTKLRKELREANVNYFVEKNTLLLRAFKNCGIEGFEEALNGTTAIALSNDDQTAPARVLGKFAEKAGDEKFNLKAGYIEGEIYRSFKDSFKRCTPRSARWFSSGTYAETRCNPSGSCRQKFGGRRSLIAA